MQLRDLLAKTDLTLYERNVILFLSSVPSATATQICSHASVPQGRVYTVLKELQTKGFVEVLPLSPKKFKIVDIKAALTQYLSRAREEITNNLDAVGSVVVNVVAIPDSAEPSVALLSGRDEHVRKGIEIMERCRGSFKRIAPIFHGTAHMRRAIKACVARGVRVQIIIRRVDDINRENVRECMSYGVQVRSLEHPRVFGYLLSDGVEALVGTEDYQKGESRTILYTKNAGLIRTLTFSFDELWSMAKPVKKV